MRKGWQSRCLGDVATVSAGNSAPQGETHFDGGTIPFFRTADAGRVRFGDIDAAADCLNDGATYMIARRILEGGKTLTRAMVEDHSFALKSLL